MDEYKELQDRFYRLLYSLVKKYDLRFVTHFTVYDHEEDYIEVWKSRKGRKKHICNIREKGKDKALECYKKGIDELTYYQKQKEELERGKETELAI